MSGRLDPAVLPDRAVVICIDANYVSPACTMLRSLARHWSAPQRLRVRVVNDDLSADDIDRLQAAAGARFEVEGRSVTVPEFAMGANAHVSVATYKKLFAPELNKDVARLLLLDCDLIVLADVLPLLELDFDTTIAAVQDSFNPYTTSPWVLPMFNKSPEAARTPYFNTGVLLLDTDRWLTAAMGPKAVAYASDSFRVRIWEQDALNAVIGPDWTRLDDHWNVFPTSDLLFFRRVRDMLQTNSVDPDELCRREAQARIMHFVGRYKPWTPQYRSTPNRALYHTYMAD